MGVLCPCGVKVNARSDDNNVKFVCLSGTVKGDLIYNADVCVTSLDTATLSLQFIDTETPNTNSFTFTANRIKDIQCEQDKSQNCSITVTGTGKINGEQSIYTFEAVFRDVTGQAAVDQVQKFVILGFFDQNGTATVTQGSVVALGCQDV